MITVSDLTFNYPGVRALDDISFHLPPRGITALVGPNGQEKRPGKGLKVSAWEDGEDVLRK